METADVGPAEALGKRDGALAVNFLCGGAGNQVIPESF